MVDNDKTVVDAEIISEEKTTPCPPHLDVSDSEEPCPIDAIFREVDDTLTDLHVSEEVHAKLEEERLSARSAYQTGERIYDAAQKAVPKVKALIDKVGETNVFLGRREMMKRSF